ncbi:MAG: methyltransferase domain-containing protein [Alphaproteobacteria bacterium]|nr:MAG: methyltransferase domain-containing protein [Alphaproteobacteria bacterium]
MSERRAALTLIEAVLVHGRPLEEGTLDPGLDPALRAAALRRAAATLRRLGQIDALLDGFLKKNPPGRVRNILRLASAELLLGRVPAHAAVDLAVRLAAADRRLAHLKGLVNAVTRRVAREGPAIWARQDGAEFVWTAPMRAAIAAAWGEAAARAMARAHLDPPPTDLTLRDPESAAHWAGRLDAELLPTGSLRLARPGQVSALPGHDAGAWWVQDAAAAIPARMLGAVSGVRVLDLCAAPGGKTLQLAASGARVTALDISPHRLERVAENLRRTGLSAEIVAADALEWRPAAGFDAVLLDTPCSATGTMRRHPDLPHRRGALDLAPLIALQDRLLDRAWRWVGPGGRLVFATCSLLPEEGEARAAAFLARSPDAEPFTADIPGLEPGWLRDGMLRLRPDYWPERGGMDGFFAAAFQRRR